MLGMAWIALLDFRILMEDHTMCLGLVGVLHYVLEVGWVLY